MRLRGPRFSVRGLMILVAVATPFCWVAERHERFDRLRLYYDARMPIIIEDKPRRDGRPRRWLFFDRQTGRPVADALGHHLDDLRSKYRRAVDAPWLPVAPDPPEPK